MASVINASSSGAGGLVSSGDSSGVLQLQNNGSTSVTLDTSGNVGIGTTSSLTKLSIAGSESSYSSRVNVAPGDNQNRLMTITSAYISCDAPASGAGLLQKVFFGPVEGYMTFSTANTERMRIDSSGNLLVGATSVGIQSNNSIILNFGGGNVIQNHVNGTVSGSNYTIFGYNTSTIGSITQNGTTGVLYNLTSDYRLKNNPVALTGAKDFVMALQPKTWDWWDDSGKGVGFIAHEFMEVAKYSGHGEKDAVDADNKPVYQSIQPSSSEVMANIVALMQEQQALITAQAETINALTARIVALEQA